MSLKLMIMLSLLFVMLMGLINQILIVYVSKKDIYLGVKIPEEKRNSKEIKDIAREFIKKNICFSVIYIFIIVVLLYVCKSINISIAFIIFAIYPVGLQYIYCKYNEKVRKIKKEKGWLKSKKQIIVIDTKFARKVREKSMPSFKWFLIPIGIIILNIVLNYKQYPYLPNEIGTCWNQLGQVEKYEYKSLMSIIEMLLFQLMITFIMIIVFKSIGWSKQNISNKKPKESKQKSMKFRRIWGIYMIVFTIGTNIILTIANLQITNQVNISTQFWSLILLIFLVCMTIISIIIGLKVGQGGDNLNIKVKDEEFIMEERDDDKYWIFGNTIYDNPNDPAVFIEKRVGIGWTINAGSKIGKRIYIGLIIALLACLIIPF